MAGERFGIFRTFCLSEKYGPKEWLLAVICPRTQFARKIIFGGRAGRAKSASRRRWQNKALQFAAKN